MKIVWTVAVVFGWIIAMQINLMGAAKDSVRAPSSDTPEGKAAHNRIIALTVGFALVATAAAVYALLKIWR